MAQLAEVDSGSPKQDTVYALANHFMAAAHSQLSREVLEATKVYICDCLAVTVAGSSAPGCGEVAKQVAEWGGRPEATILTFGSRVPAFLAAFANSTMARALDLDDVYEEAISHVSSSVVPVAFAMAESIGRYRADLTGGRELITAVALGRDLICRLGLANLNTETERGRSQSYQFNTFASAAVAGRYLGLELEQMVAAQGLAYGQGLSNRQGVIDGSMAVRVHQGLCAQLGIQAAQLARRGVTGARNIIDGKYGYYSLYEDGLYDPMRLIRGLGETFMGIDSSIKPYPCCKQSHTAMYAAVELCRELQATPDEIERIDVGLNADAYYTVCVPPERRYRPQTIFDIQFSAPWTVAVMAAHGDFFLDDLTPAALEDETVAALVKRVSCRIDDEIERRSVGRISPAIVELTLRDGRRALKCVDYVKGHPLDPMTLDDVFDKFRRCLPYAACTKDPGKAESAMDMLAELEQVPDVRELVALLA
jgi:2-methylcitrate dehydratase PrpD